MEKIRLLGPFQMTACRNFTVIYLCVSITAESEADLLIEAEEQKGCNLSLSQKLYHKAHDRTAKIVEKLILMCMEPIIVHRHA